MKYHYKAFISYRHAELDTKVAVEIQNRIERCFIPGSIRRELGINSIGRVFRDKDELPSTSDLNDHIKNAIRNSEYLICICSPRYIESVWGRREIELFLESHDRQHVLTVLAEGEPNESIPDILRSERVTLRDENGNDVTIETKLEPLSCDYRGDRHRSRTEEFPRLAAVLIGCSYADLRQKMRRQRIRMVSAAAVLASALAAYFLWSYINIQANYRQSLINQSRYLASSAQEAIDSNDNILAAQLSLAALPDQGRNRPVVPEAVYTLSQAIGAYQRKQNLNIREVASYTMGTGTLRNFAITSDAHYMAMVSYGGDIDVFDLVENRKLYTISTSGLFGNMLYNLTYCGNDRLLIYNWDYVVMIRFSDGAILWHQQFDDYCEDIIALGENDVSGLLFLYRGEILIVSAENGEILNRFMIGDASGGEASNFYSDYKKIYIHVDTENACFSILCEEYDDNAQRSMATGVLTCYYETGRLVWTPFGQEHYWFEGISRTPDGRILLAYPEGERNSVANQYHQSSENSIFAEITGEKVNLVLLQEGTGEVLWQNSMEYMGARDFSEGFFDVRMIPAEDGYPARQVVMAAVYNKVVLFDAGNGSTVKEFTLLDEVESVNQQSERESVIRVSGNSGTLYDVNYHSGDYSVIKYMEGTVDKSFFFHARVTYDGVSCFIVRQGNTIRMFKVGQGDDEFKAFGFEKPEEGLYLNYFIGTRMVLKNWSNNKIYIYDLENEKKLYEIELDSEKEYRYVGCAEDNSCFYINAYEDNIHESMLRVDLEEGTFETVDITLNDFLTGAGKWKFDINHCVVSGDYIFYRAVNYNSMTGYWFRYSMKDGCCAMLALPYYEDNPDTDSDVSKCLFAKDGTKGVFYFDNTIYLADFGSGAVKAVDSEIPGVTYGAFSESNGMFAFYYEGPQEGNDRKELHVYDAGGKKRWKIDNLAEQITAMRFHGDRLIVATESKRLYAYDERSGRQIGVIELNEGFSLSRMEIYEDNSGNLIFDNDAWTVLMVDYRNWVLTGVAYNARYCPALKWIISCSDGIPVGYFRYYSVSELVEKGKAFVGEQKMSDTDKAKFGLD